MIVYERFTSHSGISLPWKVECDDLSVADMEALACIVTDKFLFSRVIGIPRGGERLAVALGPFCVPNYPTLIVDDVLTTGKSMIQAKANINTPVIGVVIFARGAVPDWVWPIFTVSEWTQARGTGTG